MRRIKPPVLLGSGIFGLFLSLAVHAWCDPAVDVVPAPLEKGRYEALRASSPFSLASAAATPAVSQASFAANWFITGIGRIGGEDFVSIKSRDLSTQFSLYAGEQKKADEVALVSVTWSDVVGKSTVILRKGTETAKLEFDESKLHAAPPAGAASPAPGNGASHLAVASAPGSGGPAPVPANARMPGRPQGLASADNAGATHRRAVPILAPQ